MNRRVSYIALFIPLVIMYSCRKPYVPPVIIAPGSYLVVEGVINTGPDSTVVKISKTVNLGAKTTVNPVLNAVVTIEGDQNVTYPLTAAANGNYVIGGLSLDVTHKYRLRIKTANDEYLSDYVPVVNSPAIDSVSYNFLSNGIQMYVSTHDAPGNARHFRWDYQETWIIHSYYYSFFKSNGDSVIDRNFINDQVYQCWQSDTSSTIALGSSAALSQNVVKQQPLTFIPSTSPKLDASQTIIIAQHAPSNNAYSILVKQYALSNDAYTFWLNLKKNTEDLGSIFDAQPSQISGNIHSTVNPSEPVIGYVSAGTVTSKRIFITNRQIPVNWLPTPDPNACTLDSLYLRYTLPGTTVVVNQEDEYFNYNKNVKFYSQLIPIYGIYDKFGATIGHTGSTPGCVDCTLRGTNIQPAFWQ